MSSSIPGVWYLSVAQKGGLMAKIGSYPGRKPKTYQSWFVIGALERRPKYRQGMFNILASLIPPHIHAWFHFGAFLLFIAQAGNNTTNGLIYFFLCFLFLCFVSLCIHLYIGTSELAEQHYQQRGTSFIILFLFLAVLARKQKAELSRLWFTAAAAALVTDFFLSFSFFF